MKDLLTGEDFVPKRTSQKFANSANRIKYNNKLAAENRRQKEFINKPLHENYKILNELMGDKLEASFHDEFLRGKGFDFTVFTHLAKHNGKPCYCLYQFLKIHENGHTKFVRNS